MLLAEAEAAAAAAMVEVFVGVVPMVQSAMDAALDDLRDGLLP